MIRTILTETYGIRHPIASAGMAFVGTVPLVRGVCAAGGLGVLGASGMPVELLRAALHEIKRAGHHAFGVNIIPRFNEIAHIELCVTGEDFLFLLAPARRGFFWR
jgi:enoyl-[acyl-carrier protein] reductase II